jgi:hypothetical protein
VPKSLLRCALAALLIALCVGASCHRSSPPPIPTKILSKVEYFKEKQANTKVPHGTIDMNTVKETAEGVEYSTSDGRHWQAVMERTPTGWHVRDVQEMK